MKLWVELSQIWIKLILGHNIMSLANMADENVIQRLMARLWTLSVQHRTLLVGEGNQSRDQKHGCHWKAIFSPPRGILQITGYVWISWFCWPQLYIVASSDNTQFVPWDQISVSLFFILYCMMSRHWTVSLSNWRHSGTVHWVGVEECWVSLFPKWRPLRLPLEVWKKTSQILVWRNISLYNL